MGLDKPKWIGKNRMVLIRFSRFVDLTFYSLTFLYEVLMMIRAGEKSARIVVLICFNQCGLKAIVVGRIGSFNTRS